jgi:ribosomal-protein-alanine N-acetyltransferase
VTLSAGDPPPPETRPVERADAPALALVHAACFDEPWSAIAILEVLAMPGAFGFAIMFPGLPPAAFALARVNTDEAELLTLAVGVAWRRHGLARHLIGAVAGRAAAQGARRLFLEVAEDNAAARALYASEGFAPVGRRRGYYVRRDQPAADALTLRRDLPPAPPWFARA